MANVVNDKKEIDMTNKSGFVVLLEIPEHANTEMVADYIENAVKSYKGGLHADEPMFQLDRESVSVHPVQMVPESERAKHEASN